MTIADTTAITDAWGEVEALSPPQVQSAKIEPRRTALLLLDFLRHVCTSENRPRAAAALPKLHAFLAQARARKMLAVHTTIRRGVEDGSDLADALKPVGGERVFKAPFNKFHGSDLEQHLKGHGIDTLVIAVTSSNGCLLFTVGDAILRCFRVIVPIDGMPAATPFQEQFVVWQLANGPGFGDAVILSKLEDIEFA